MHRKRYPNFILSNTGSSKQKGCQRAKCITIMVRHVILWKLKEELSTEEKEAIKKSAKEQLEGLYGTVPSIVSIAVHVSPLPSSSCDMMLDSLFENEEGLAEYSAHPAHVAVANAYVRPYVSTRICMDHKA